MAKSDKEIAELDEKLKALGMIPLSQMLNNPSPLGQFSSHKGVTDFSFFEKWLEMRYRECMTMKARFIVDGREDDEMYEWVLSHSAVFSEVLSNFKAAKNGTN